MLTLVLKAENAYHWWIQELIGLCWTTQRLVARNCKDLPSLECQVNELVKNRLLLLEREVWRNVELGFLTIPKQIFVMIRNMVTSVILGADFRVRLGELTLDFKNKCLKVKVPKFGLALQLFETNSCLSEAAVSKGNVRAVYLASNVKVPPSSEIIVEAVVHDLALEGHQVLVEPQGDNQLPTNIPFTVCRVKEGRIQLRVANISNQEVKLSEGEQLGEATNRVAVLARNRGTIVKKGLYKEAKIGDSLNNHQHRELINILEEYNDVFYDGGELPLVRVGIEHTIRVSEDSGPVAYNPRRVFKEAEEELRKEIKSLEDMGII